jgi:alpha-ribazole phosphatase
MVAAPMQVYLVRHPQPSGIGGLCYGRLDVAVEPQAIHSTAESVGSEISAQTLSSARVYSSPSLRCLELARRLASPRRPTAAEDLMEMSFGDWEGLAWDAVPREQLDAWAGDVWNYRPGGGESAEMVAERWLRWLNQVRRTDGGAIVAVTHAGVIRVALARAGRLNGLSAIETPIPFGSVHRLDLA